MQVLSDEKHLFPLILEYMKEKLKHPRMWALARQISCHVVSFPGSSQNEANHHVLFLPEAAKLGIPEDWIVQRVKQKKPLWELSTARITAAIERLEDTSHIFAVAHKTYKCVLWLKHCTVMHTLRLGYKMSGSHPNIKCQSAQSWPMNDAMDRECHNVLVYRECECVVLFPRESRGDSPSLPPLCPCTAPLCSRPLLPSAH